MIRIRIKRALHEKRESLKDYEGKGWRYPYGYCSIDCNIYGIYRAGNTGLAFWDGVACDLLGISPSDFICKLCHSDYIRGNHCLKHGQCQSDRPFRDGKGFRVQHGDDSGSAAWIFLLRQFVDDVLVCRSSGAGGGSDRHCTEQLCGSTLFRSAYELSPLLLWSGSFREPFYLVAGDRRGAGVAGRL